MTMPDSPHDPNQAAGLEAQDGVGEPDGFRRLSDHESGEYAGTVVSARMRAPDGPQAPLRQGPAPAG